MDPHIAAHMADMEATQRRYELEKRQAESTEAPAQE